MGQISKRLARDFRDAGRQFKHQPAAMQKMAVGAKGVRNVQQLLGEGYDPLHAAYISAQNIASAFAESVSQLDEFTPYYDIIVAAEDEYMPSGPPMSPLTGSYFTTWAFFDVRFGKDQETIGTCLLDVADLLGMNDDIVEVIRHFQGSRMGIYEHCGTQGSKVRLRELVTGDDFLCHVGSRYEGKKGEIWFVRLCPPIRGIVDYHVAFTTPYVLIGATKADWTAYLNKSLIGTDDTKTALHELLKYGRQHYEWPEFVFQAYHHHRSDVILLAGLPDVKGSLPHASEPPSRLTKTVGSGTVYRLKVTLKGIKPPIWRRIETHDCSLLRLHELIQIAMGWDSEHLFAFDVDGEQYGDDPMGQMDDILSAKSLKLSQILGDGIKRFHYTYDFGDSWEHTVLIEKTVDAEPKATYPRCVKGKRACPPEDCGGPWGYSEFLDAIQHPEHDQHEEMLEWVGGEFDPEKLDLEAVNREMKSS